MQTFAQSMPFACLGLPHKITMLLPRQVNTAALDASQRGTVEALPGRQDTPSLKFCSVLRCGLSSSADLYRNNIASRACYEPWQEFVGMFRRMKWSLSTFMLVSRALLPMRGESRLLEPFEHGSRDAAVANRSNDHDINCCSSMPCVSNSFSRGGIDI